MTTKISPRVSESATAWLTDHFKSKSAGAEYVLEAFPELYRRELHNLTGVFSTGELSLMLDVMNGHLLTPQFAGQSLSLSCEDGMSLDGLHEKWEIDREAFLAKLSNRTLLQLACLEIWARAFWESGAWEKDGGLEAWVAALT